MALERLDGTFAMGASISIGKARTAVLFKKPTRFFEELINKGRTAMTAVDGFTPLIGGIPIIGGEVVGGIGVSGAASANQDEELALAGAAAFFGIDESRSTFKSSVGKRGEWRADDESDKRCNFYRREADRGGIRERTALAGDRRIQSARQPARWTRTGQIHTLDTDVIYVVAGSATLITGGKAIDAKEIAPNEIRGTKIEDGEEHQIGKGEVIIIPNGVPHQFTAVTGELHYFVCKPTASAETHLTTR